MQSPALDFLLRLVANGQRNIRSYHRASQVDPPLAPRQRLQVARLLGIPAEEALELGAIECSRQGVRAVISCIEYNIISYGLVK